MGNTVTLRRSPKHIEAGLPRALVPYDFISTDPLQDSLLRIGLPQLALFPNNLIASMAGFQRNPAYFTTEPGSRVAPKVAF